ncbi:hypothetical protein Y1Q_0001000 [Alligator mississippiensis]|uniref:Uncharacterized protein n=1 Tax=Alligator mississippiensis TaxID=8496 RepID=A0A151NE64_ALLMI|nr:hypothetical protein Y1Q_0001000 [Alligator mississippiensis]
MMWGLCLSTTNDPRDDPQELLAKGVKRTTSYLTHQNIISNKTFIKYLWRDYEETFARFFARAAGSPHTQSYRIIESGRTSKGI